MAWGVTIAALTPLLAACSTAELTKICENAGGRYTSSGCDTSTPAKRAAQDRCETQGGVYLAGQERCAFGEGGP